MASDDWRYRYIGEDDWILDLYLNDDPTDRIIENLDYKYAGIVPTNESELFDLHALIEQLPSKYYQIIWAYYYEGKPITQIGRERGVSKQYIHQLLHKALKMLRELANEEKL